MKNTNIGTNNGVIGDENIIIFNTQSPLTQEQVEKEFLKLEIGDFQDITSEVDEQLREKREAVLSYIKNPLLQLKKQLVNEDFDEPWLPKTPSGMGKKRKNVAMEAYPGLPGRCVAFFVFFHRHGQRAVYDSTANS
jgi:hypothetical protein